MQSHSEIETRSTGSDPKRKNQTDRKPWQTPKGKTPTRMLWESNGAKPTQIVYKIPQIAQEGEYNANPKIFEAKAVSHKW
jgi:hypothetical protein